MLVCDGRDMAVRYKDLLDAIMVERAAKGLPTFDSKVVISWPVSPLPEPGPLKEQAAEYQVELDRIQSIEERIKAELKAGKTPVAMPSEQIGNFVSKLFPCSTGRKLPSWMVSQRRTTSD